MSEEIKELTDKETMKILDEFATTCYDMGVKDALIGVSVGAIFGVVIVGGFEVIKPWKDKKKTEKRIKEFNTFVKEEIES